MTLLALDFGATLGWAARPENGRLTSGTMTFRNGRFEGGGMRWVRYAAWLDEMHRKAGPLTQVWFEEVNHHAGVRDAHAYGGFLAHLTAWCEAHSVPYAGVSVGTIKKFATGKGNANKDAMIAAIRAMGHAPADHNEADAIALLLCVEAERKAA